MDIKNQNQNNSFVIAVLSAKGGVGKTMLAASLVDLLGKNHYSINALDCDVNSPNLSIWLGFREEWDEVLPIKIFPFPNRYKKCQDLKVICDGKPIKIEDEERGEVKIKKDFSPPFGDYKLNLISGNIDENKTGSGKVVEGVIGAAETLDADVEIIDSAPGTGYPVITPLQASNFAILLTEATVLGFHDLKKLVDIAKINNKNFGIVVNKWSLNPKKGEEIKSWSGERFLGKVDFSSQIEEALESEMPPTVKNNEISHQLENIYNLLPKPK
jgi:MinD superfamily P-loop ATPase